QYVKRYEIKAVERSEADVMPGRIRDVLASFILVLTMTGIVLIFATVFIIPFTKAYPYDLSFTFDHVLSIMQDREFLSILSNSIIVAGLTAVIGTIVAFVSALIHVRTGLKQGHYFNWIAMLTNAIPGMVLGIAYLFMFNGSSL